MGIARLPPLLDPEAQNDALGDATRLAKHLAHAKPRVDGELGVLRHELHRACPAGGKRLAVDAHLARPRRFIPRENTAQRRLAKSRRRAQGNTFTRRYGEVEVLIQHAAAIAERDTARL